MNEKTRKQIESMKAQTFGVEVEMNNITRSNAAKIAADFFGTNDYGYSGTVYYTYYAKDAQGRTWNFSRDSSISGPDDEKCELVTPVLHYDDMETLQELIRRLRKAGAKSSPSRGCGVHIHIGGDGHTPKTILNLCNLMAKHEKQLIKGVGIASSRLNNYCEPVNRRFLKMVNEKKPQTNDELADIWYRAHGSYNSENHYNHTRYHMLNLHAYFHRYHTIEFRLFQFDEPTADRQGGLHAGQLKAMIQLCLAMSQLAKQVKFAWVNPQNDKVEMSAMNHWFYRLGFVGDEFKTAREYFARNAARKIEDNTIVPTVQIHGRNYYC